MVFGIDLSKVDWTAWMTLVVACVTAGLALEVRGQTSASSLAERARQREVHLLAVQPLLFAEPEITGRPPTARFETLHSGTQPILNLTITLRGRAEDGSDMSQSGPPTSIAPGDYAVANLELGRFLAPDTGFPWNGSAFEVIATYTGLLGQWVVEHYEWDYNARATRPADDPHVWRLYRFEIEPRGVSGASSIDLRFGVPPKYV